MNKLYYLHPFLIAIAPAIFLWSYNFAEIAPREVLPILGGLIVFAGFILTVSWLVFRDFRKMAIVASVFLVLTLFYQYIFFNPIAQEFMSHQYAFLFLFAIIGVLSYAVKRTKKDLTNVNQVFFVVFGSFVLISLFQLGMGYYADYRHSTLTVSQVNTSFSDESDAKRDIYYIILDQYMAPRSIKSVFGFEEEDDFTSFLKEQGFFIAEESRSNYKDTTFSLPSSLNMRYLDEEETQIGRGRKTWKLMEDHFVKDFLKERNYRYIHAGAYSYTYFNRYADININIGLFSPFQMFVWETTALRPISLLLKFGDLEAAADKFGFLDKRFTQWKRVQFKLEELAKIPKRKEPTFVFAHMMIPHPPYVFDAEGNYLTAEQARERSQTENYLGQVAYINREIKKLIGEIIRNSELAPIIIIQGDHGHRLSAETAEELSLAPERRTELSVSILNAYYFPDGGDYLLYDHITPVNSFRILFNYYFNQNFELLEDKSYVPDPKNNSRLILLP